MLKYLLNISKRSRCLVLIRWGNTLKRGREPIVNHFDNHTTNGFTEGYNTKIISDK
ncbi:transposase [Chloroflexota bacterium]